MKKVLGILFIIIAVLCGISCLMMIPFMYNALTKTLSDLSNSYQLLLYAGNLTAYLLVVAVGVALFLIGRKWART